MERCLESYLELTGQRRGARITICEVDESLQSTKTFYLNKIFAVFFRLTPRAANLRGSGVVASANQRAAFALRHSQ
jgi:hypothetical protein